MANLTFPSNPTNGQKVTLGDKVFVYSNTTSRWTATKLNVFGNLTGDFTIAPPELSLSNNTVAFSTTGETVYITYTVDQDVKATIANNGIANSSYANVTLHQTNNTIEITAGSAAFAYANVVLTVTNTRTSNTAWINLSASYGLDWANWTKEQAFQSSDVEDFDFFGYRSDIDGDTIVAGAGGDDDTTTNSGAIYIFERSGSTWSQTQKLKSNNITGDTFGDDGLAIDGDWIAVGNQFADPSSVSNAGVVELFHKSGGTWSYSTTLDAGSDRQADARYGIQCAMHNGTLVVSAQYFDTATNNQVGKIYIYTVSGTTWSLQQSFVPIDSASAGWGASLAIYNDSLLIGSTWYGTNDSGTVLLYERSGSSWSLSQTITSGYPGMLDSFGWSCDINDQYIAIGEREQDMFGGPDAGRGYIYEYNPANTTWYNTLRTDTHSAGSYGQACAVGNSAVAFAWQSEDTLGGNYGAIDLYYKDNGTWANTIVRPAASDLSASAFWPNSLSMSNDTVVGGARYVGPGGSGTSQGTVIVFRSG